MRDLRTHSGVSLPTIQAIEAGGDFRASTGDKIVTAFERHHVQILNGDSPGARFAKMERRDMPGRLGEVLESLTTEGGLDARALMTLRLLNSHASSGDAVDDELRRWAGSVMGTVAPASFREIAADLLEHAGPAEPDA